MENILDDDIKIYDVDVSKLSETEHNPRQISKDDFAKLKKSMRDFPKMTKLREVVIDENMVILGGHQRVKAAIANGQKTIRVKQVFGLTDAEKREFVIKDNIANGEWDMDAIANAWDDLPLDDWGLQTDWGDEPEDLDADDKDDKEIYVKITFKSADEANTFLDEQRETIESYDCSMTTHGGGL